MTDEQIEAMIAKQKEVSKTTPFLNTEMGQYAYQLGFEDGVDYALSHQWVSVEDKLPNISRKKRKETTMSKLQAKDLMVGDYVQFPKTNHIFKVQTISGGEQDTLHYVTAKNGNGDFLSRSEWEGVPLTAEILFKNFPSTEILIWYCQENKWHIECPAFDVLQVVIEIQYVHELQHAVSDINWENWLR